MRYLLLLATLPLAAQQHTVDRPFVAVTVAQFGSATWDIETTQRCIRAGTCREGNPLMGQSRAQEYAVAFGGEALVSVLAYKLKEHGERGWWILPGVTIGMHGALGELNLRF